MLPPGQTKEEVQHWERKFEAAKDVLALIEGHLNKELSIIEGQLESPELHSPQHIIGFIQKRNALIKLKNLITIEEKK